MSQGETVSFSKLFQIAVSSGLADINTCLPGQVVSYDRKTQTAKIQPNIQIKYADGRIVDRPIINRVPVGFPGTKDALIHFDLKPDDYGILVFSQRSLDKWKEKGGIVTPDDPRKFNLSDAYFIPGGRPAAKAFEIPISEGSLGFINKKGIIEVSQEGKFKITNGENELLDLLMKILEDTISTEGSLEAATVNTFFGPMKLNNFADFTGYKASLEATKEKLLTLIWS